MPNRYIMASVNGVWSREAGPRKRILDLSCGGGDSSRMLASHQFEVIATDFGVPPPMDGAIRRVGGVDLNEYIPFKSGTFDGVNLVEVIEHIEHQAQLIREIGRVLKKDGVVLISTPNVLNVFSRIRFLFTGFLRGRVRPVHFARGPGMAPNIYLIHFYELYYLLSHYGFEIEELKQTKIKFAPVFFGVFLYPLMWLFSLEAVIRAEKEPVQRSQNWKILRYLFHPALLLSDNIVVKARKRNTEKTRILLSSVGAGERERVFREFYDCKDENLEEHLPRLPSARRRKRIRLYQAALGEGHGQILEIGCDSGDLTHALAGQAEKVFGTDISSGVLRVARSRKSLWNLREESAGHVQFVEMNATHLAFPEEFFDRVVSTSVVEHLHPDDVQVHLKEVWRVLKPSGKYLIWCPNGLGHHKDRDFHLSMHSYREWIEKMKAAGFREFRSPLFNRPPLVDARFKVYCEDLLSKLGIQILWSHLGVRNVFLLAKK